MSKRINSVLITYSLTFRPNFGGPDPLQGTWAPGRLKPLKRRLGVATRPPVVPASPTRGRQLLPPPSLSAPCCGKVTACKPGCPIPPSFLAAALQQSASGEDKGACNPDRHKTVGSSSVIFNSREREVKIWASLLLTTKRRNFSG